MDLVTKVSSNYNLNDIGFEKLLSRNYSWNHLTILDANNALIWRWRGFHFDTKAFWEE